MKDRLLTVLYIILWCTLVGCAGYASNQEKNRPNSLGVSEQYQNPNAYLFAIPTDGTIMDGATNIRFQPYATAALYDESVLFCGDVSSYFDGKRGPLVVTYRREAARKYKGVGCHELISVFEVKAEQ